MGDDRSIVYVEDGVTIFRASALGGCPRAGYAARDGMTPLPPPEDMAVRFADGHVHEVAVVNLLTETWGADIRDDQLEVSLPFFDGACLVRGHIDGIVANQVRLDLTDADDVYIDGPAVLEIKSMSQASYEKWIRDGFASFPKYAYQIAVYMHALGMPAVYVVKNKNSGKLHVQVIEEPPVSLADIEAKVALVHLAESMPQCGPVDFPCPYLYLHDEDLKKQKPADAAVVDDPVLEQLAGEYALAKEAEKAAALRKDHARDDLLGYVTQKQLTDGSMIVGPWKVNVSMRVRTSLDRKQLEAAHPEIQFDRYTKVTDYTEVRVDPTQKEG